MLEKVLSLPIEQKVGQLFFIGLSGVETDSKMLELLEEISPGGICLFARNIKSAEQTRRLLDDLRSVSIIEPLLSLDQEGGLVDRLRRISTPMPSAAAVKTIEQSRKLAEITAEVVRILGFNMNFAPVSDVTDEKRQKLSNGLYSRLFGTSKQQTIDLAGAYLTALQAGGCLGCLKHFPGLGAAETDSHEELPLVRLSQDEMFDSDLYVYREILKSGQVHAVMSAHAAFPTFKIQETDANGKFLPSSLSKNFVTELLRRELEFKGLAITDDLEMGAIVKNYGIAEACKMAVAAGEDMITICADPESIRQGFRAVSEAVKNKEISEARLDQSLSRIAQIKSLTSPPLPFDAARLSVINGEITDLNTELNYRYGG